MKNLLLPLVIYLGLIVGNVGCAEDLAYAELPATVCATGPVEFCDEWGCRWINAPYYHDGDNLIYWDVHFGCWIGPHGYWRGGVWHRGFVYGYHEHYHAGTYHVFHTGGHFGSGHPTSGGHFFHSGGGHGGHR